MSQLTSNLYPGAYWKHHEGEVYKIIGIAIHAEIPSELVIYRDEDGELLARSVETFLGTVEGERGTLPRFKYIGDDKNEDNDE